MANPSLQIGNDNWAIKEDNLLGYSTAGTRFVPQPITMTRATLGTRVNPSGLVEDVALLGSELVTNGDFATDSDWDKTGTWSIESNYATSNANGITQYLGQDVGIVNGRTYKITYTVLSNSLNNDRLLMSGTSSFTSIQIPSSIGQNTVYLTASQTPSSGYDVRFANSATNTSGIITLDNISVKEATIDNLPRVDYTDGTSSLLVEPQRTNLITYSSDFSQWTEVGSPTLTPDYGLSPDGTENSTRIELSTNARIYTSLSASGDIAFSVYLKGSGVITLRDNTNAYRQDVTLTSEWARYDLYFNATITNVQIQNQTASVVDCELWGAQTEVGSYPTSYIKTSGSTVTRNQETYEKTGISDKINSEEGVLFAEIAALANDGTFKGISLSDGSTSNVVRFYTNPTANQFSIRVTVGGVHQFNVVYTLSDLTAYNKVALKYKANDFAFWVNGVEVKADLSGTTFASNTLNKLALSNGSGSDYFFGKVKQLQVFKTALSDSELATLTT